MFRGLEETLRTFRRSPVKIYSAGTNDRYFTPYRLGKVDPDEGFGRVKRANESCYEFILDSGIGKDEVTNETIIEWAERMDPPPDYIVPKDYLHDPERTTESVEEFLDLYEESDLTAEVIIPLQPTATNEVPNADHADHYEDWTGFPYYAIGGVKEADTEVQLRCVREFREEVGYPPRGPRVHLFGVGANMDFIGAVRDEPRLVQSADLSTLDRIVSNARLEDKFWKYRDDHFPIAQGDNTTTVHGWFIGGSLTHLAYMLGPDMDDEEIEEVLDPDDGREQVDLGDEEAWGKPPTS